MCPQRWCCWLDSQGRIMQHGDKSANYILRTNLRDFWASLWSGARALGWRQAVTSPLCLPWVSAEILSRLQIGCLKAGSHAHVCAGLLRWAPDLTQFSHQGVWGADDALVMEVSPWWEAAAPPTEMRQLGRQAGSGGKQDRGKGAVLCGSWRKQSALPVLCPLTAVMFLTAV